MSNNLKTLDKPRIIKRTKEYFYETNQKNNPKFILILENKNVDTKNINTIKLNNYIYPIDFKIDYNNTNPDSKNNIFNYMNEQHANIIKEKFEELNSEGKGFGISNYNFAYHYFIDKKGNIYEGRPFNVKPFNLDIFQADGKLLPLDSSIFSDTLTILIEENTEINDTTEATYTALKSLLKYLIDEYDFKKFYGYSELVRYDHSGCTELEEDAIFLNNPGLFFRFNELHSSVYLKPIKSSRLPNDDVEVYTYGKRVLRYHKISMKGNDISMLQIMLYKLGILDKYEYVNGIYGIKTKMAVERFQKLYYITPTEDYGVADINTLLTLRDKIYNKKMNNLDIYDTRSNIFRVLEYRPERMMSGSDVYNFQVLLKNKIDYTLNITGVFDKQTELAAKKFKSYATGKTVKDGKIGPETYKKLLDCKLDISFQNGYFNNLSIKNESIKLLQRALLNYLKEKKSNLKIYENGCYDKYTSDVISIINSIKENRIIMGIEKYGEGKENFWKNKINLLTCYPEEYNYLLSKYLFKI